MQRGPEIVPSEMNFDVTVIEEMRSRDQQQKSCVISLNSPVRTHWDAVVVVLVLYELLLVPVIASFKRLTLPPVLEVVDNMVYGCFCVDLVMNFCTSYYVGEVEVMDQRAIAKRYMTSRWFWIDLISVFPSFLIENSLEANTSFVRMIRLLRLLRLGKLFKQFDDIESSSMYRLMRLILFIAYNMHWIACLWNGVISDATLHMTEWYDEENGSLLQRYSFCAWCGCSFLLGIGALNPQTVLETSAAAAFSIYGACLQACVFGSVAVLIAGLDAEEAAFTRKIFGIKQRLRHMSLPEELRSRVLSYYTMLWSLNRAGSANDDGFVSELSPSLQIDIRLCLFREMFTKIPFFSNEKINPLVVEALVTRLRTTVYLQGDIIMRKGERGDWMGFIGRGGKISILDPSTLERRLIKILYEGDYVGEIALLFNLKRTASVEAFTLVRMHILTQSDYNEVMREYKNDARILRTEMEKYFITQKRFTETQLRAMQKEVEKRADRENQAGGGRRHSQNRRRHGGESVFSGRLNTDSAAPSVFMADQVRRRLCVFVE